MGLPFSKEETRHMGIILWGKEAGTSLLLLHTILQDDLTCLW